MTSVDKVQTPASHLVTGLFDTGEAAEEAYLAVTELGYVPDEIGIVLPESTHEQLDAPETSEPISPLEGAGVGGALGGAIGAVLGAVALGTAITIPGLGLAIAGPVIAALAGAGAGGVSGGLAGALVASGLSQEAAASAEASVRAGKVLLSVVARSESEEREIRNRWRRLGATFIEG